MLHVLAYYNLLSYFHTCMQGCQFLWSPFGVGCSHPCQSADIHESISFSYYWTGAVSCQLFIISTRENKGCNYCCQQVHPLTESSASTAHSNNLFHRFLRSDQTKSLAALSLLVACMYTGMLNIWRKWWM